MSVTPNEYGWFWEDDPDLMLPHAKHIVVNHDDGTDICVIVLRNEFLDHNESVARVENNASRICKALALLDAAESII